MDESWSLKESSLEERGGAMRVAVQGGVALF